MLMMLVLYFSPTLPAAALRFQRTQSKTAHLGKLLDLGHKLGCSSHRLYIPSLYVVHIIEVHNADVHVPTRGYSAAGGVQEWMRHRRPHSRRNLLFAYALDLGTAW